MKTIIESPALSNAPLTHDQTSAKVILSMDNGFTAGLSCLLPDGKCLCRPVKVTDLGREKFLDIDGNLEILNEFIELAGVPREQILAIYEQGQINPFFSHKTSFASGKNGEFWRVLLTLEKIPFTWVNPKQWQKDMFRAVRGTDTKAMAELVCRQRFPNLDRSGFNKVELEGIHDALCIALWAREHRQ